MLTMSTSIGSTKTSRRDVQGTVASYAGFAACFLAVYNFLSDGLASLLTLSAGLQALAFMLLVIKVQGSQSSVSGISLSMLGMYSLMLGLRLCGSTIWLDGYLPADATGDWLYQCAELLALVLALWLFCRVRHVRKVNYGGSDQEAQDSMPGLVYICSGCVVLAWCFHTNLNDEKVFDAIWACACYMETAAMLPQLWMMSKAGGELEALTSHFIALTTLARFFSFIFWYWAFEELAHSDGADSLGHYKWIIGAHLVQLVLACDFLVIYVKNLRKCVPLGMGEAQWI